MIIPKRQKRIDWSKLCLACSCVDCFMNQSPNSLTPCAVLETMTRVCHWDQILLDLSSRVM